MSEFRRDLISGRRVIIAPRRSGRPAAFSTGSVKNRGPGPAYVPSCPFCAGNERMTPPEILKLGHGGTVPDTAGWKVRVVPNRYPAVEPGAMKQFSAGNSVSPGYGIHEVLIESPVHDCQPRDFSFRQMELVIEALCRRGEALAGNPKLRYLQFYRNYRREAGASIEHPHSQLIALPFVPAGIGRELGRSRRLYRSGGVCPFCRLLEEEIRLAERIIIQNDSYSAFIPYAARRPFEIRVLPRRHASSILETGAPERADLARILVKLFGIIARALGDPPYNCYLRTAPLRCPPLPYYHWHIGLQPKIGLAAGFEMGSGVFINEIVPEEAARFIREKGKTVHEQSR